MSEWFSNMQNSNTYCMQSVETVWVYSILKCGNSCASQILCLLATYSLLYHFILCCFLVHLLLIQPPMKGWVEPEVRLCWVHWMYLHRNFLLWCHHGDDNEKSLTEIHIKIYILTGCLNNTKHYSDESIIYFAMHTSASLSNWSSLSCNY